LVGVVTMYMKIKRLLFLVLAAVCFNSLAVAQKQYYNWDFSDCELKELLFAISLETGISIVPDDTVSGKGDLKFAGKDFEAAFETFLTGNRLYVQKAEKVWTVSKFNSVVENGFYTVDAYDLTPMQIIEKLSGVLDMVITFDVLPGQKMSVHFRNVDEITLIESLCRRFGNYEVLRNGSGVHISKKTDAKKLDLVDGFNVVEMCGDAFSIDVRNCYFEEVIEKLFELGKQEGIEKKFCLLGNGEVKISRVVYLSAEFNDILEKVCWQTGFSYVQEKDVYYIFLDSNSKENLLSGKRTWKRFSLDYTTPQDFIPIIYKRLGKIETVELNHLNAVLLKVNEKEEELVADLIKAVDVKQETYLITFKYIQPGDFINHLPPSVDKNSITIADDLQSVYFRGTEKSYDFILSQVELCDRPASRITYDLLILQYDETKQNLWSSNFDCKRLGADSRNSLSAVLGSVAGFNLNVISAFGLNFAVELQSSIEENNARVYADTTLHGLSGKQINFQNTNTYRYRDNNVNPETGLPVYSGVTREISSGIKLDISGWVSGEGLITSKVTASISRQGTDTSSSTGNPPPTSEKLVTTEVCGKSGEPVILSGLVLTADSEQEKRTPGLSKIPLFGYLFKNKTSIKEKSQMVIYLVPHIEDIEEKEIEEKKFDEVWVNQRMERIALLSKKMEACYE